MNKYDKYKHITNSSDLYGIKTIMSWMYDITFRNIFTGASAHFNGKATVGRASIISNIDIDPGVDGGFGVEYKKYKLYVINIPIKQVNMRLTMLATCFWSALSSIPNGCFPRAIRHIVEANTSLATFDGSLAQ